MKSLESNAILLHTCRLCQNIYDMLSIYIWGYVKSWIWHLRLSFLPPNQSMTIVGPVHATPSLKRESFHALSWYCCFLCARRGMSFDRL